MTQPHDGPDASYQALQALLPQRLTAITDEITLVAHERPEFKAVAMPLTEGGGDLIDAFCSQLSLRGVLGRVAAPTGTDPATVDLVRPLLQLIAASESWAEHWEPEQRLRQGLMARLAREALARGEIEA